MFHPNKPAETAESLCDQGNQAFTSGNCLEALILYNRAMCSPSTTLAKKASSDALCYANRSAVYLEMKYFKHCLNNIELAEEHNPVYKVQKLYFDRRAKCKQLMEASSDRAYEPLKNPFKLSYKPNPKLPFFIDALKLKEDNKFGRHLITDRNLKAGDVIAVMEDCWTVPSIEGAGAACANCLNVNNFDLKSYQCCSEALFCSETCHDQHQKIYKRGQHQNLIDKACTNDIVAKLFLQFHGAFGSVAKMKQFIVSHGGKKYSIFDFDLSRPNDPDYMKNMLLVVMSVVRTEMQHTQKEAIRKIFLRALKSNDQLITIIQTNKHLHSFIDEVFTNIAAATSGFGFPVNVRLQPMRHIGMVYHPSSLLLNHSCDPNVTIHPFFGKQMVWIVNRPLKAGSQIFMSYNSQSFYDYDSICSNCDKFNWTCNPCEKKWRRSINLKKVQEIVKEEQQKYEQRSHDRLFVPANLMGRYNQIAASINNNFDADRYENEPDHREIIASKFMKMKMLAI